MTQSIRTAATLLLVSLGLPLTLFAQGSLTPSGAPAPTMKTLTEVEPRTPISSVPYYVTNSGSYYLTGNLLYDSEFGLAAIQISASGVTIDLNGFSLLSTTNVTGAGIRVAGSALMNIKIRNGMIQGNTTVTRSGSALDGFVFDVDPAGFSYGVTVGNTSEVVVEDLLVRGCRQIGIYSATWGGMVRNCYVSQCGENGISGSNLLVRDCHTWMNGEEGIHCAGYALVIHCIARLNGVAGITLGSGSLEVDCLQNFNGP